MGTITGFRNIPVDELREHLQEIPREKPVVVSCAVGLRGYLAARILMQHGFQQVFNLSGGYKTWSAATAPLQQPAAPTPEGRPRTDSAPATDTPALQVDACGLMCPGPVMQLKKNYASLAEGETLLIKATDQAFGKDVASWCKITGAELTKLDNQGGIVTAWVRKVKETDEPRAPRPVPLRQRLTTRHSSCSATTSTAPSPRSSLPTVPPPWARRSPCSSPSGD